MTGLSAISAVGALAAVLLLIWLIQAAARAGLLRRVLPPPAPRADAQLALVESLALDPRRRLTLVRCDGRRLLLLTGGERDVVVGWIDAP